MNVLKRIKLSAVGAVLPIVAIISLVGAPMHAVASGTSSQACSNSNSVIPGGVSGIADLKQTYAQNPCGDVQQLYNYFGITSASQFSGMVFGHVDDSNNVYVDTKNDTVHTLVATNAVTAGRDNISGSIAILGGKFYKRPPSVSFASGTLNALIKLDSNNQFLFAIITSCGNPVIGKHVTPKPQPTPQPKPTPTPTTTTKTTVKVVNTNTNVNVNNNTNTVTTAAPASQAQPTELPDTGAGSIIGIFTATSSLGALGYRLFLRHRLAK